MSNWFVGRPTTISVSPPPGVRLPWWDRSRKRRAFSHMGRAGQVVFHNPRYRLTALLLLAGSWGTVVLSWAIPLALVILAALFVVWVERRPNDVRHAMRGWWRSNRRYRWTWGRTLRRCSAAKLDVPLPLLVNTRSTGYVDKLRVHVPTGLDPTAFQDFRGDLLKWGWRGKSTRVFNPEPKNHTVELWNLINDPLVEPVQPFQHSVEALPKQGLQLFLQEDGEPWFWPIRGGAAHLFVCGISGSGKGSVIGAIIDALQAGVADRSVELLGIDPQASELGMYRHVFKKLVYTQADAANMLEELGSTMDKRTRTMFGITRQHQPAPGDPLYVLIADEGLDLLDKADRATYKRIVAGFGNLTRKGRKASIIVVFISQRAELDLVEIRKDFPNAIALQLNMDTDVDMVLGRGALASGARAHEIRMPGEVYAATEQGIVRGRFPYFTDDYIRDDIQPAPGNEDADNRPPPPDAGGGPSLEPQWANPPDRPIVAMPELVGAEPAPAPPSSQRPGPSFGGFGNR